MTDITLHFVDAQGVTTTITGRTGTSLMLAAVEANLRGIDGDCGGTLTCATCHVMVREPWPGQLPPMSSDEDAMLDFAACARQANSRLSCQITLTEALDGLSVDLPASQY